MGHAADSGQGRKQHAQRFEVDYRRDRHGRVFTHSDGQFSRSGRGAIAGITCCAPWTARSGKPPARGVVEAADAVEMILTEGVTRRCRDLIAKRRLRKRIRSREFVVCRREGKESRGHMEERLYDLIFICRPDTPEADVDKDHRDTRAHGHRKGRQDREDGEVGPEAHGLPRAAAARGILRVHGRAFEPWRSRQGTRAPAEGCRPGDEIYDRAHGRGIEAAGQIERHRDSAQPGVRARPYRRRFHRLAPRLLRQQRAAANRPASAS